MIEHIQVWVREVAGLAANVVVQVREEPHCPDPACPLRRIVIFWTDAGGHNHRAVIVKPLAYIRRPDIERAVRLPMVTR
jgi:hypothetical protein